jgi:hypothetical protein
MPKINIEFDKDNFTPIIEKMHKKTLDNTLFTKPFKSIFNILNLLVEFTTVDNGNSTAFTRKLFVSLNPTESFRVYSTAFLTLDFESFIVEHNKFLSGLKKI